MGNGTGRQGMNTKEALLALLKDTQEMILKERLGGFEFAEEEPMRFTEADVEEALQAVAISPVRAKAVCDSEDHTEGVTCMECYRLQRRVACKGCERRTYQGHLSSEGLCVKCADWFSKQ